MKRKNLSQQLLSQYTIKDILLRKHSPILNKPKSTCKVKINRSKQQITNKQSNNSITRCTQLRPKNIKKMKEKLSGQNLTKQSQIKQKQIMSIINYFATKIQKQWRVHQLRSKFKLLIKKIQAQKKQKFELSEGLKRNSYPLKLQQNDKKRGHLDYLQDSNFDQIGNSYNHQKYEKSSISSRVESKQAISSISYLSQKNKASSKQCTFKSIQINVPAFQKETKIVIQNQDNRYLSKPRKSKDQQEQRKLLRKQIQVNKKVQNPPQSLSSQIHKQEIDRRVSYDYFKARQVQESRRHSTGQLYPLGVKRQLKPLQIDKVIEIKIDTNQQGQIIEKNKRTVAVKSKGELSSSSRRFENDKNAYNIKFPLQKILKKYKKDLQITKLKKLLSIENRYNRSEITQRSYSQTIIKINQQHKSRLQQFKEREGLMKSNWLQLLNIHKTSNLKLSRKYLEDIQDFPNSTSNIDVSTSFDKWDFNSSAKKSIENNLDFSDNPQSNSKIMSIESVLKELEEEDNRKQQGDRKFKKNKSLQVIEAIAERSKEVSQRDTDSIHEVAQLYLSSQKKQNEVIVIQEINLLQEGAKQSQLNFFTPKLQNKQKYIQVQPILQENSQEKAKNLVGEPKFQDQLSQIKSERQSLLISQIKGVQPNQLINSEPSLSNIEEKNIVKDLIFKDFKTSYHISQTSIQQYQIQPIKDSELNQQNKKQQTLYSQNKQLNLRDPLIRQFLQIVKQKVLLNTIKTINSIKFIMAKSTEYAKTQKQKLSALALYPPIETDINAINTWLLQISHFILDNYQSIIKDNLTTIKQPPIQQLLELSKKNSFYYKIYQTIPEYVFKDFQFYYIKTLAKNAEIPTEKYDSFSTLQYTFHRSLVDSLNISLMDQLITGKNWLTFPWKTVFRKKRRVIENGHAKTCLQRSINLVSNWGEFGLGRLCFQDEYAKLQSEQYEQQKINLVSREQAFEIPLSFMFTESYMLFLLSKQIFDEEVDILIGEMFNLI